MGWMRKNTFFDNNTAYRNVSFIGGLPSAAGGALGCNRYSVNAAPSDFVYHRLSPPGIRIPPNAFRLNRAQNVFFPQRLAR